jgi:hypothetical protein
MPSSVDVKPARVKRTNGIYIGLVAPRQPRGEIHTADREQGLGLSDRVQGG